MAKASILKALLLSLELSEQQFAVQICMPADKVVTAISNEAELSNEMALRITLRFPHINQEWLRTGEGLMFVSDDGVTLRKTSPLTTRELVDYTVKEHGVNFVLTEIFERVMKIERHVGMD